MGRERHGGCVEGLHDMDHGALGMPGNICARQDIFLNDRN